MRDSIFVGLGALGGATAWLAFRHSYGLDFFDCIVSGVFGGTGLHALVFGQISMAGRFSRSSPKLYQGASARVLGCLLIAIGFLAAAHN